MFATVKEGLIIYQKILLEYVRKVERFKKHYGEIVFGGWDDPDYNWVKGESARLKGMEEALGITKEEAEKYLEEAKEALSIK